ncbi:hypothetical protein KR100_15215 [Synechococcus sp. KORDI-100]|uniref:type II secretion system protein GspD n=1 Tax=Synechococcus sp. KORDI-100 TaxID=1280380 RepID=UPI0004E0906E|nr:type II and III secretion system protein [Synechococcus sp. KORDI-100]AII44695.1 hypothetical protein KR100_15215 [Synechococcus sp. KORDI-100]
MLIRSQKRLSSLALVVGLLTTAEAGLFLLSPSVQAQQSASVELRVRRLDGNVDIVIAGAGSGARVVEQQQDSSNWRGRLSTSSGRSLRSGAQQLSLPGAGLKSIQLDGSGSTLELQIQADVGVSLPSPRISSNGQDLIVRFSGLRSSSLVGQTGQLDLRQPGRVAQPTYVPPMQPRAMAPPVGDMAVGTMLINNRSFVNVSGPPVTLTLNNAPAKDALMSLARLGGYGFVYVGDPDQATTADTEGSFGRPVSMAFRHERFDRALNSVLMASGLQGKLDGRTLLVGTTVAAKTFGPQMSKVFRLNQVGVEGAAQYLASLGAAMTHVKTIEITTGESQTAGSSQISNNASQTRNSITETETFGSATGPLLGLSGVTNSRLNTVTLVGDPSLVSVAESYLKQLDLRKRQVAVKIQIMSVTLTNDKTIDASFSSRIGNTFLVSQSGNAHMNFGKYKPGSPAGTGIYNGTNGQIPGNYQDAPTVDVRDPRPAVVPLAESATVREVKDDNGEVIDYEVIKQPLLRDNQEVYVPDSNPNVPPDLVPVYDKYGRPKLVPQKELNSYSSDSFYAYLEALIVSSSAKTLAQPTLLVQEGESAKVETGESVITGVTSTDTANGSTQFQNDRKTAGLKVDLSVDKIDDNGFVTLNLSPEISVPIPAGTQQGVGIFNVQLRKLESGSIRLRDGQSLILTGVITDSDRQQIRKWPILGDMPLIGQLFRQSASSREKNELVIIVTPTIIDDEQGGTYGYGYRPSTPSSRQLLRSGG